MKFEDFLKTKSKDMKKSLISAARGANEDQRSLMDNFRKEVNAEENKGFTTPNKTILSE